MFLFSYPFLARFQSNLFITFLYPSYVHSHSLFAFLQCTCSTHSFASLSFSRPFITFDFPHHFLRFVESSPSITIYHSFTPFSLSQGPERSTRDIRTSGPTGGDMLPHFRRCRSFNQRCVALRKQVFRNATIAYTRHPSPVRYHYSTPQLIPSRLSPYSTRNV